MSDSDNRLSATLESHPRLLGALLTVLLLASYGVSVVAAGGGSGGTTGL